VTGLSREVLAELVAELGPRWQECRDARAGRSAAAAGGGAGARHRLVFINLTTPPGVATSRAVAFPAARRRLISLPTRPHRRIDHRAALPGRTPARTRPDHACPVESLDLEGES
jgi:hypothetical protein